MSIEIPIFTAGTHVAMNGEERTWTDDDLVAIAHAYDPDLFDAPVVIGHPEHNDPAWGWVEKLSFRDGSLWATLRDLHADFVGWVRNKNFKKISASFYLPDSGVNPKPGSFYLRHIGFLGAVAPSLKSLPAVNLSESDGALTYEEKMYYHPAINLMQSGTTGEIGQHPNTNHTENDPMPDPKTKDDDHTKEIQDENARLRAENEQLKAQSSQFQEQATSAQTALAERERAAIHDGHAAFCDKLVTEGRLLPANKAVAVAALDLIASQEKPLEFSEGEGRVELTADKYKSVLQAHPVVVDFGERTKDDSKPEGTQLTQEQLDICAATGVSPADFAETLKNQTLETA